MLPMVQGEDARPDLRSSSASELSELVARLGEKPYRARQLYSWLHRRGAASLGEMTDLPRPFRERLAAETRLATLAIDAVQQSSDGTRKYRLRTQDGKLIESVYMPDEAGPQSFDPEADEEEPAARVRRTLCVSTQVGCAMGCGFCMTATMGLVRNLSAGEIADQVYRVNADLRALGLPGERPLTNLVYMGMGEPLHNYDNVLRSLELLLSEEGANFSQRHITVSTSGLVPNIGRFAEDTQVRLPVKVNLIPYNENPGLGFGDPGAERLAAFRRILSARGITAMVRKNRGRDIAAACGQLAVEGQRKAKVRAERN